MSSLTELQRMQAHAARINAEAINRVTVPISTKLGTSEPAAFKNASMGLQSANQRDIWQEHALAQLKLFLRTVRYGKQNFTINTFKDWYDGYGGKEPINGNSWGGLWSTAEHAGLIEKTGMMMRSSNPAARGRKINAWRKK